MFLLIDKPKGMTSHDVVDEVRKVTGQKKVGHAGTLDPNATGLLIVAVGRESTKKLGGLLKKDKVYEAQLILGETRDTDDVEGKILEKIEVNNPPTTEEVKKVLKSFIGKQKQAPSIYSAIKVKGKKAYELAREGKKVELEPRDIEIFEIHLLKYEFPTLKINIKVSSGTYIRSLARDVGEKLESGAYLKELRRTQIGFYSVEDAVQLKSLDNKMYRKRAFNID